MAMALTGFALVLISNLRIFGGVVLMVIAAAVSQYLLRETRKSTSRIPLTAKGPRARLWLDLIWGAVMPVMCLLLDPVMLRTNLRAIFLDYSDGGDTAYWLLAGELQPYAIPCYTTVAVQIVLLCVCLWGKKREGVAAALLGGGLCWGGLFASFAAVVLAMPATLALFFFGAGMLGFAPVAAAFVYFPRGIDCYTRSRHTLSAAASNTLFAVGAVLACLLPLGAGILLEWLRRLAVA